MNRGEMENMLAWRFTQAGGRIFPFDQAITPQIIKEVAAKRINN